MPSRKYKTKKHSNKTRKNRHVSLIELSKMPALRGALIVKGNFIAKGGSGGIMSTPLKKAVSFAHNVMDAVNGKQRRAKFVQGGADEPLVKGDVDDETKAEDETKSDEPKAEPETESVSEIKAEPEIKEDEIKADEPKAEPVAEPEPKEDEPTGEESFVDSGKDEVEEEPVPESNEESKEEPVPESNEESKEEPVPESNEEKPAPKEEVNTSQELEPGKMLVKVKPTMADVFGSKREFYVVQDTLEPPKGGSRKNRKNRKSKNTKRRNQRK